MHTIKRGTMVRVLTTNGGDLVAPLLETYRVTYNAIVGVCGTYAIIGATRIKSVTPVAIELTEGDA